MRNMDKYIGISFIIISIVFFIATNDLPEGSKNYPRFLIGIMAVLSIIILIKSFIEEGKNWGELFGHIRWKRFLTVIVISTLYLVVMNTVGYFTSTILYLIILMVLLRAKTTLIITTTPIFVLGLYFIFKVFLKIPLPSGFLL